MVRILGKSFVRKTQRLINLSVFVIIVAQAGEEIGIFRMMLKAILQSLQISSIILLPEISLTNILAHIDSLRLVLQCQLAVA